MTAEGNEKTATDRSLIRCFFFWGIMARSFSEIDGTANTAGGGKETVLSQDEREDKIASGID